MACPDGLETVDGKGEKRHFELASRLKVTDQLPFQPPMVRTHLLVAESQRCCLHWSLLPQKSSTYPSNPANIRYLATLQVWQKQGMPSYRSRLKAKESKPPRNTPRHILGAAKQESMSRALASEMFPRPLLPSLTVSRVVIPISTHRVLRLVTIEFPGNEYCLKLICLPFSPLPPSPFPVHPSVFSPSLASPLLTPLF